MQNIRAPEHCRRLYYEEKLIEIAKEWMKGKKCFFDIGAGMGYWSYIASDQGVEKIVAFEPIRQLSNFIIKASYNNSLSIKTVSVPLGQNRKFVVTDNGLVLVKTKALSLDFFVQKFNLIPDLIKIDVDGKEEDIILGAINTLKQHRLDLILEIRSETLNLLLDLKSWGYKEIYRFGDDSITVFLKS